MRSSLFDRKIRSINVRLLVSSNNSSFLPHPVSSKLILRNLEPVLGDLCQPVAAGAHYCATVMGKVITDTYNPFDSSLTPIRAVFSVKEGCYFEQ